MRDPLNQSMITTVPGENIATATASRNCRSSSQWKSFTTPPCRKGTMARPLPNTTAPAPVKNQRIFKRTGMVAGPSHNWVLRDVVEGGGDASLVEASFVEG